MKTIITYTLPDKSKIKLRELKVEEHLQVSEAWGQKNVSKMVDELVKRTMVEVHGQVITGENRDVLWSGMSAKERDLVRKAYSKMHSATEEESSDFLGSAEMEVTD